MVLEEYSKLPGAWHLHLAQVLPYSQTVAGLGPFFRQIHGGQQALPGGEISDGCKPAWSTEGRKKQTPNECESESMDQLHRPKTCTKSQGNQPAFISRSRGLLFATRAGGHIDMFAPIYR